MLNVKRLSIVLMGLVLLVAGVAMTTAASSTSGRAASARCNCISTTES